jgi:hypothetical protein
MSAALQNVSPANQVLEPVAGLRPRFAGRLTPELLESRTLLSGNVTIVPTYDSSIKKLSDATTIEATIQAGINQIESLVTANTPVKVTIKFQNQNSGLGGSNTAQQDIPYSTYLADLQANPNKSANDTLALSNMPAGPGTGINKATKVLATAAQLDAIGDPTDAAAALASGDGYNGDIFLNLSIMNHSRPGTNANKYDLESTVLHEMDEVLGIGGNATTLYQAGSTAPSSLPTDVAGLDFFRYTAAGARSFTYSTAKPSYFSIDGGKTPIVYFNQENGNNGADYGDWDNPANDGSGYSPSKVQDAYGNPGITPDVEPNLGVSELTGLDVIGFNLISQSASKPTITLNPVDQTVADGTTVTLTSAATGTPKPTVTWQISKDGGKTWHTMGNRVATRLILTNDSVAQSGFEYRAAYTNSNGTTYTTAATITVIPAASAGTISGIVYEDVDGSGVFKTGDVGISGVTVFLDLNQDFNVDSGDPTAVSDANGSYSFTNVAFGEYLVEEVVPSGESLTGPTLTYYDVTLEAANPTATGQDFGNTSSGLPFAAKKNDAISAHTTSAIDSVEKLFSQTPIA